MASVKSSGTTLEQAVARLFRTNKISGFVKNPKNIPGNPDIIFKRLKIAVFIDSCFWHGCPKHFRMPNSNHYYWLNKIGRNIDRDKQISSLLRRQGWSVLRIWEHDLKKPDNIIAKVKRKIAERKLSV